MIGKLNLKMNHFFVYVIIFLVILISFFIINIQSYFINQTIESMNRQVSNIGMGIENRIYSIEEEMIFDVSTGILNLDDVNSKNIKRFLGRYSSVVEGVTIYNEEIIIKFTVNETNHLNRIVFSNKNQPLSDEIVYNYDQEKKTIKIPFYDQFGHLRYNYVIEVNYDQLIEDVLDEIFISGKYWTWYIDDQGDLNPVSYSETKDVNARFRMTQYERILSDIQQGYKGSIQNNVSYDSIEEVSTAYYPIYIGEKIYGIGVSVFTLSLTKNITFKVAFLSFFFILLMFQVILYFNYLVDKEKKISSDLNASEETIRRIIDSVPFGIVLFDDTDVLKLNNYAQLELGIERGSFHDKSYETLLDTNSMDEEIIVKMTYKGEERSILKKLTSIKYEKKDVNFMSFIDVTIINKAKELAEETSRAKSRFLTMVSHEIRTPLNGIIASTDLLEDTAVEDEEAIDLIGTIKKSSISLMSMINDILEMSKIESGRTIVNESWIDLRGVTESVFDQMKPLVINKDIEYTLEIDSQIPNSLWMDENKLRQILINLIGNAIKFTDTGKISVIAHVKSMNDGFITLEYRVADTGIGIPADKIENIFEKFVQVEDANNRSFQGSGLGTTITRELLTLLGGRVRAISPNESIDGVSGSEFIVELTTKYETTEAIVNKMTKVEGMKVLLADDNRVNAKVGKKILESFGFIVSVVYDGQQAVEAYDYSYDLVLMDIQMPVKDGYQAACDIRKLSSDVIILALTANDAETVNDKLKCCGIDGIIEKPFKKEKVKKIIKIINN